MAKCPVCQKELINVSKGYCCLACYQKSLKYKTLAVRDNYDNIIGYRSTTTGEMVEWTGAATKEFQEQFGQSEQAITHDKIRFLLDNPEFLEID